MHPQILSILENKAKINNKNLVIKDFVNDDLDSIDWEDVFGIMFQYPDTYGGINIPHNLIDLANNNKIPVAASCDILSLVRLKPPGQLGIDIAFGTSQRFGVPMWFGGPHPAYLATTSKYLRNMPGRIIGKSIDSNGDEAFRLALQTREQHIRKDKATSNICTSQSLLTNVVAFYAMYHGRNGLQNIYDNIHNKTLALKKGLEQLYIDVKSEVFFDTLWIEDADTQSIYEDLKNNGFLIRLIDDSNFTITLDETHRITDIVDILNIIKTAIYNDACPFANILE